MPRKNWTWFLLVRRNLEFRTQKLWDTWIQFLPLHTCTLLHFYVHQSNLIITLPRKHVKIEPVSLSRHPQNLGRKKATTKKTHTSWLFFSLYTPRHQTQPNEVAIRVGWCTLSSNFAKEVIFSTGAAWVFSHRFPRCGGQRGGDEWLFWEVRRSPIPNRREDYN